MSNEQYPPVRETLAQIQQHESRQADQAGDSGTNDLLVSDITELRSNGRQLVHAINQLLEYTRAPRSGNDERKSPGRRGRKKRG